MKHPNAFFKQETRNLNKLFLAPINVFVSVNFAFKSTQTHEKSYGVHESKNMKHGFQSPCLES